MSKMTATAVFLGALLVISYLVNSGASADPIKDNEVSAVPGRIIVKLKNPSDEAIGSKSLLAEGFETGSAIEALGVRRIEVKPGEEKARINELLRNPLVEYAEPDYLLHVTLTPNDPQYIAQWNLTRINAPQAWDISTGQIGADPVTIAIVDTGVNLNHPDLIDKIVPGATFVNGTTTPDDDFGHGTHVAGIAAAASNNSVGIAGVNWGAKIMPVKVLNHTGYGPSSIVAEGITYAADHGARIINLSLGGTDYSQVMKDAISYALSRNVLVVAAMGNSGNPGNSTNPIFYPAAYPGVLAVVATDSGDMRASFSCYNDHASVSAPGVLIHSSVPFSGTPYSDPSGYRSLSGTSMATPHVSGLAALLLSVHPEYSWSQLKGAIEQSSDDLGPPGWDQYYGWGRINAYRALTTGVPATGVKGTVEDPKGNPAAGAIIASGGQQTSLGGGFYQMGLPPTTYDVSVSQPLFGSLPPVRSVVVNDGQLTPLNLTLPSRLNFVQNGGFESGTLTAWTLGGSNAPTATTTLKHSGNFAAFLGIASTDVTASAGISEISQTVWIPISSAQMPDPTLSFMYKMEGDEHRGFDWFRMEIESAAGDTLDTVLQTDQGTGWKHVSYDLTPWGGQSVALRFSVSNDNSLATKVYLDEVSVGPLTDDLAFHSVVVPSRKSLTESP